MKMNVKAVKKVKKYLKKGLSYREMARLLDVKDTKTIYRWARYKV